MENIEINRILEEKIRNIIRKLEIVAKSTRDPMQKQRVAKELKERREDLRLVIQERLPEERIALYITDEDIQSYGNEPKEKTIDDYKILRRIKIKNIKPGVENKEINELYSFLKYFEDEYSLALSDNHLKLDYNHSYKRDTFFNSIQSIMIMLDKYAELLLDLEQDHRSKEFIERLKSVKNKEYINLMMKVSEFAREFRSFIDDLIRDYESGGNIVLNPENKLHFSKLHGNKFLEGFSVVDAIRDAKQFLDEFIEYFNLPEI